MPPPPRLKLKKCIDFSFLCTLQNRTAPAGMKAGQMSGGCPGRMFKLGFDRCITITNIFCCVSCQHCIVFRSAISSLWSFVTIQIGVCFVSGNKVKQRFTFSYFRSFDLRMGLLPKEYAHAHKEIRCVCAFHFRLGVPCPYTRKLCSFGPYITPILSLSLFYPTFF